MTGAVESTSLRLRVKTTGHAPEESLLYDNIDERVMEKR
jgi:hypothetical protein